MTIVPVPGLSRMIELPQPGRISFCTSCKNRLWQLEQTMPRNLAAIEEDGSSEMVLVNYNSQDELDAWIRQFQSAMEAGTLRYVHERADCNFHASKAKNLSHFAATGEFVVNLDADNFIGDTIAPYRSLWAENRDTVIHGFSGVWRDGSYGRIGMANRHFRGLGGYDEEMLPMAYQDMDLLRRASAYGLDCIRLGHEHHPALQNDGIEKVRHTGSALSWIAMKQLNSARSLKNIRLGRLIANPDRKPRTVLINFSKELHV